MENPIKMDDLGVPPFSETSMYAGVSLKISPTRQVSVGHVRAGVAVFHLPATCPMRFQGWLMSVFCARIELMLMKHEWLLCIKKWKVWLQNSMELRAYLKADSLSRLKGGWRWTLDESICQLEAFLLWSHSASTRTPRSAPNRRSSTPASRAPRRSPTPKARAARSQTPRRQTPQRRSPSMRGTKSPVARLGMPKFVGFFQCVHASCLLDDQRLRFANPWTLALASI